MPKPGKGEKKPEFIQRCIPMIIKEGKTSTQAAGECYGIWNQHLKEEMKKRNSIKNILYNFIYKK